MAVFLLNSRLGLLCATPRILPTGVTLLPKLRVHFAEFLNASSLERLRFLILPPCVGLRYGLHMPNLRHFSWHLDYTRFVSTFSPLAVTAHLSMRICLHTSSAYCFDRNYRSPAGFHLMRLALETYKGSGL